MSNYHILDGLPDGNSYHVAFHVAIPTGNNAAGVPWRTAVVQFLRLPDGTQPKSAVPFIASAEQTQMDNGEIVERIVEFSTDPGQTGAQKQAALDALYNEQKVKILAEWQERLRYWGFNRNVP